MRPPIGSTAHLQASKCFSALLSDPRPQYALAPTVVQLVLQNRNTKTPFVFNVLLCFEERQLPKNWIARPSNLLLLVLVATFSNWLTSPSVALEAELKLKRIRVGCCYNRPFCDPVFHQTRFVALPGHSARARGEARRCCSHARPAPPIFADSFGGVGRD